MCESIYNFLFYGYDPSCGRDGLFDHVVTSAQKWTLSDDPDVLLDMGKNALRGAIASELNGLNVQKHVVPLSSGFDSRAILGLLVDNPRVDPDSIVCTTFGLPGTWDFQIGQRIAEFAGCNHIAIDFSSVNVDWSKSTLRRFVQDEAPSADVFEGYLNRQINTHFDHDIAIWSGFFGDVSAGKKVQDPAIDTWQTARQKFIEYNEFSGVDLPSCYDPASVLPNHPYTDPFILSYYEQLDIAHRQTCYIQPVVLGSDDRYVTPFLQPDWLQFILNCPTNRRRGRSLFLEILSEMFPDLMAFPSDATYGLSPQSPDWKIWLRWLKTTAETTLLEISGRSSVHPKTNYLDWNRALRKPGPLRETIDNLISSFASRTIEGIDASGLWRAHLRGANNEKIIRAICSAELVICRD